jgi:hypothetical protein
MELLVETDTNWTKLDIFRSGRGFKNWISQPGYIENTLNVGLGLIRCPGKSILAILYAH